jgi:hypothetical protein
MRISSPPLFVAFSGFFLRRSRRGASGTGVRRCWSPLVGFFFVGAGGDASGTRVGRLFLILVSLLPISLGVSLEETTLPA